MFSPDTQVSIESGYLILTMMPSLYCEEKCPHCYLSKEQRADKTVMSVEKIQIICNKIDRYYSEKKYFTNMLSYIGMEVNQPQWEWNTFQMQLR